MSQQFGTATGPGECIINPELACALQVDKLTWCSQTQSRYRVGQHSQRWFGKNGAASSRHILWAFCSRRRSDWGCSRSCLWGVKDLRQRPQLCWPYLYRKGKSTASSRPGLLKRLTRFRASRCFSDTLSRAHPTRLHMALFECWQTLCC